MIALTQLLAEYSLIIPVLEYNNQQLQFSVFHFSLLVLSTVLIAAGGYVINDYADMEIDKVNKPDKLIVGKHISKPKVLNIYAALTITGIAIALYLALHVNLYELVFIQVIVAGLLYFYAFYYKRELLLGNIIISLLSGLTIILPFLYEMMAEINQLSTQYIYFDIAFIYAGFAFITTLIREIIKDAEDMEGDRLAGCNTLPIAAGLKITKLTVSILLLLTFCVIAYFQYYLYTLNEDTFSQFYISVFIQAPLLFLLYKLVVAKEKKEFGFSSKLIKLIMLSGILSMPVLFVFMYQLSE
jgi:4-hydroxybenzoate polyprenyltransferase